MKSHPSVAFIFHLNHLRFSISFNYFLNKSSSDTHISSDITGKSKQADYKAGILLSLKFHQNFFAFIFLILILSVELCLRGSPLNLQIFFLSILFFYFLFFTTFVVPNGAKIFSLEFCLLCNFIATFFCLSFPYSNSLLNSDFKKVIRFNI